MKKKLLPLSLLLFLGIVWGSGFAIIKVILFSVGPLWIMFCRIALGSLVLLIWLFLQKRSLTFNKEFWFWSFIIGFLGFNFPFSIIAWGQQYIPSSLTAILMGINPILTLILSYFLLKDEEITTLKIFGILIGFLGLILLIGLNNSDIVDLNSMFMFGQIAVLLGTSSYALATVLTKKISHIPPTDRAIGSLLSASLIGLFIAILFEPFPNLFSLDFKTISLIFILGILSTGIATFVWFKIVDLEGPIFMSMVNYLIPIWALILGIYLLDESLNFAIIIGMALILSGIWLIQRKKIK